MAIAITCAYLAVLGALTLFGLHRLHLVWLVLRYRDEPSPEPPTRWPVVTVQLPLFNEATVAARLIDAVAQLDYPEDRLEIQVLDDSTDETTAIVSERVARHRARGVAIEHVRRPSREGFKAGALAYGLERAEGELIAIFDADFVPQPSFLRRCVPHFADRSLGLVQAGWDHLNRETSLLTRLQALALDAHFLVEQCARGRSGRFFNFNGTAGVFRRLTIETAGGWSADTITEDLELSLRAQLCGWRFRFLTDLAVPAELPDDFNAFRTQQQRWTRGSGQTARKLLGAIWRTPDVPVRARVEATAQLLLNAAYPLLLALTLLTPPFVASGAAGGLLVAQWVLFGLATGSVCVFYAVGQRQRGWRGVLEALALSPALFAVGMGLSLSNGIAYLRGLWGTDTAFVRTPKRGQGPRRYVAHASRLAWLEVALGLYALGGVALGHVYARPLAIPWLGLIGLGFFVAGFTGLRRSRAAETRARIEPALKS